MNALLFGKRIRKERHNLNLTLEQLAEKCDFSSNFLGQLERGKNVPSIKSIIKIANALEVSIDGLLFDNLGKISSTHYFSKQIDEITKNFTASQKLIVVEGLGLLKDFVNKC